MENSHKLEYQENKEKRPEPPFQSVEKATEHRLIDIQIKDGPHEQLVADPGELIVADANGDIFVLTQKEFDALPKSD